MRRARDDDASNILKNMKTKNSIVIGTISLLMCSGIALTGVSGAEVSAETPAKIPELKGTDELVETFKRLVEERVEYLDPEAVEIMESTLKNAGKLDISVGRMKALVERWSAEDPPAKVAADFERLLYEKVREKEEEAVRIYQQAVKDGGKMTVTYRRMKELVAKWSGKEIRVEDMTEKLDPEFTIGKSRVIPFTTKKLGQLMLTRALVNGVQGIFIIDTGSSHSLISSKFAGKLGISDKVRTFESRGKINNASQKIVRIGSLEVSDTKFDNFDMLIVSLEHLTSASGQEISGLIGSNLLSVSPYMIRFVAQKIVFGRPGTLEGGFEVPLIVLNDRPAFEMTVNGRKNIKFIIDSGATGSTVPKALYEGKTSKKSGHVEIDINTNHGGGVREYGEPDTMTVAGKELKLIPLKLSAEHETGLLGADFLRLYDIFVDTENQKLYFWEVRKK